MDKKNAIEVRNMTKSFKVQTDSAHSLKDLLLIRRKEKAQRHVVLEDINLDIKKGETVALVGTNGSGKSTLLKLMTKIIYPNSGTIQTSGKLTSLLELGAGFHPDFTGRENISFNAAIFGLNEKEIAARMDEIIEFSELGPFIDEPIRTYSSGMYMRLAFSIAINVDADILLIDEILAVGDQHFQEKCYEKLRELRDSDKTIVIVSHSLDVVKDLCTRAIWIYKGHFRMDGHPAEVIDSYLKQIAIDNVIEKEKQLKSGNAQYSGVVYIDGPRNYVHFTKETAEMSIGGWKVSDCKDSRFEVYIGTKQLNHLEDVRRDDVMEIYSEQYRGFVEPETIGWSKIVNFMDYLSEADENGKIKVTTSLKQSDGTLIAERDVNVIYDGEI